MNGYKIVLLKAIFMLYRLPESERVCSGICSPTDVVNLWGDPTKAKAKLGWNPSKTTFEELVKIMVDADMAKVAVEKAGEQIRTNLAEYLEKGIVK